MFICTVLLLRNPIENCSLRLCLHAYRTSPASSLHVEANEPPLCFRWKKLEGLHYAKTLFSVGSQVIWESSVMKKQMQLQNQHSLNLSLI